MVAADGTTPSSLKLRAIKAHRKSRAGCFTCKGRRVKCCETRPTCRNCSRGGFHCVYPERQPTTISVQPGGVQYQSRGFSLKDMRFFHDFMTASYPHLPLECDHAWTNDVPLLAQQHEFLMHAILALGAAHIHRNTNLELQGTVERHRAMALSGLVDSQSDLSTPRSSREDRLNAQLAAAYALNFTASYMGDTMTSFLTFVRGCASLTRELLHSGYSSPFFVQDGHTMSQEHHTQVMTRRLQGARLAPFPDVEEIQKAKRSLSHVARVCTFTPVELQLFLKLQNVLDKSTEPIKAYSSHATIWNILATMDGDDFARFTDMTNLNSVMLQAHFLALDALIWPLSNFELPKGRPKHMVSGVKSICALPSYSGPDQEIAAQLVEWPISFLNRDSGPSTADIRITSGNSTPG